MDTKKLRQKILDLAIHGKLVPQDPNDEPASVLLERIKAEKEQLIKEGKIKRQKKSASSDKSHYGNDVPFEVPDGWVWCRLGDIGKWQAGATPSRTCKDYYGGNIPWLKTGDLNDGYIENIPEAITVKALNETSVKLNPAGSVLIAMYGATIGKIGILKFPATTNQACCACAEFNGVRPLYLFYFLRANRDSFIEMGGGGAQPNISKEKIIDTFIPIPPIDEQKRIIDAISHYFSIIAAVEYEQIALRKYVTVAKSKILDLALSGRLTSDTSHYPQLPDGWEYKQLEEVAEIFDNVRIPLNANERENRIRNKQSSELYPYYGATGQVGLVDEYLLEGKFLLLGEDGAPFLDKNAIKAYPVEGRFWVNNHAHILKPKYDFDFLMYYLNGLDYKAYVSGSTRLKLTQSSMSKIKIPMPPKEEQRQISQILNRIFKKLDSIVVDL